jgi:hypothetical protein
MNASERFEDFAERVDGAPDAVREVAEHGRYLAINPMADEIELLLKMSIPASSCAKVDLYWEYDNDVRFVQVQARTYAATRSPGVYVRRAPSGYVNLVVVVEEAVITSEVVADALRLAAGMKIDDGNIGGDLRLL